MWQYSSDNLGYWRCHPETPGISESTLESVEITLCADTPRITLSFDHSLESNPEDIKRIIIEENGTDEILETITASTIPYWRNHSVLLPPEYAGKTIKLKFYFQRNGEPEASSGWSILQCKSRLPVACSGRHPSGTAQGSRHCRIQQWRPGNH